MNEYQSIPSPVNLSADAARLCSSLNASRLVVVCLEAARAEDRLAQPLEAEHEQQAADDETQRLDRDQLQGGPEDGDQGGEHDGRRGDADER